MLIEELNVTPFLLGRWKCGEILSKSQKFYKEFPTKLKQMGTAECERFSSFEKTAFRQQQTKAVQVNFTIIRLGLFKFKFS